MIVYTNERRRDIVFIFQHPIHIQMSVKRH